VSLAKLHSAFMFGLFFDFEDGEIGASETSIKLQQTMRRYIVERINLQPYSHY
jgi:hypothetical protein